MTVFGSRFKVNNAFIFFLVDAECSDLDIIFLCSKLLIVRYPSRIVTVVDNSRVCTRE